MAAAAAASPLPRLRERSERVSAPGEGLATNPMVGTYRANVIRRPLGGQLLSDHNVSQNENCPSRRHLGLDYSDAWHHTNCVQSFTDGKQVPPRTLTFPPALRAKRQKNATMQRSRKFVPRMNADATEVNRLFPPQ
jgi:hypothetical protein